jgi:aspartate kinase
MALIVQKYGGTSVANLEKIRNVAERVVRAKEGGNQLVVVLSAMAGETDRLIGMANQASDNRPDDREYDALIATGEQVTVTLLALTLNRMGHKARSFLAPPGQDPHRRAHTKARSSRSTPGVEKELKRAT